MQTLLSYLLLFLFTFSAAAQNLVLNPGFEEFTDIDAQVLNPYYGVCRMAMDLEFVSAWKPASDGTPDVIYLNDIEHAHSGRGVGRALVTGDNIEYFQGVLQRPLEPGEQVFVQLWVTLEHPSSVAPAQVGICLHAEPYHEFGTGILNATPDIAWNEPQLPQQFETWMLLTGIFTAKGKEQYFTIGNFKPFRETEGIRLLPGNVAAMIRMDDVSITPLRPLTDSLPEVLTELKPVTAFVQEDVFFNINEAVILPDYKNTLNKLLHRMLENREVRISIEGHTDNDGTAEYNLQLSTLRAKAVKAFLANGGVGEKRIETIGFGESSPRATNDTPEGKALNRRIEVKVL